MSTDRETSTALPLKGGRLAVAPSTSPGEAVRQDLEQFGLNGYEARVLLALLRSGSATAAELARVAGVPRTSVYPVLQELAARGLAEQVPGKTVVWVSPGRDEILERLYLAEEERLHMLQARMEQTRRSLELLGAENETGPLPYLHFVYGAAHAKRLYDRLLIEAKDEVVVFNLPPYSWPVGQTNFAVFEALRHGVEIRALYQESELVGPNAESVRIAVENFHRAGVKGRIVDHVPAKLVVADRNVALLGGPTTNEEFPTILHIEEPGIAAMQAAAFDQWWASSRPYVPEEDPPPVEG